MVIGLLLAAGAVVGAALAAVLAAGAEPPVVAAGGFAGAAVEAALLHATTRLTSSEQASHRARRSESMPSPNSHLAVGCSLAARPSTSQLAHGLPSGRSRSLLGGQLWYSATHTATGRHSTPGCCRSDVT